MSNESLLSGLHFDSKFFKLAKVIGMSQVIISKMV